MNQIKTAEQLAKELGDRSQILKHNLVEELDLKNKELLGIYNIFENLIKDLTIDRFANLYTQTIAYGLFFAAIQDKKNELSRTNAYTFIPNTIPILNKLFYFLTNSNLPKSISFIVDDMIQVLRKTSITSILQQFKTSHWTDDPLIHFYETFLQEYDPETRHKRGVFYTPAPVVSYIMKSLHSILKKTFQKNEGLANHDVKILDPAAGSMTFLDAAIHLCYDELKIRGKSDIFEDVVKNHILNDFFAFEILVAPYTIGHFKIFNTLRKFGITQETRTKLFLTNTLDFEEIPEFNFLPALNKENIEANKIKQDNSIFVICGNPPYEMSSMNKSKFISKLMIDYKKDVSSERNIQPLDNDYLKFLRYAHWKINQNGFGVIGLITSNSFLDGIIHRGIRKTLLNDFDKIYILNLHGSSRRNENPPDGKLDENVFDIMQGVSILFLIKTQSSSKSQVFYQDLWGEREEKYDFLTKNFIDTTKWLKLTTKSPNYFFAFFNEKDSYSDFFSITDIFIDSTTGVKTHRDKFIVSNEKNELIKRLENFSDLKKITVEEIKKEFSLKDTKGWDVASAREKFVNEGLQNKKIKKYHYRPLDFRFTYHSPILMDRPRGELMDSISTSNLALVVTRQVTDPPFEHVFVTDSISDINLISNSHGASFFPLFRILNNKKISNISQNFVSQWSKILGISISDKDIFYYVYAILFSKKFREEFINSLLRSFPKIPLTSNVKLFSKMVDLGEKLVNLHLLKTPVSFVSEYPISGTNLIQKPIFDESKNQLFINKEQFFSNIYPEMWNFKIGSFSILEKWLQERKKTCLNEIDIVNFQKIVNLIHETKTLQQTVDELFPEILNSVIKISVTPNLDSF